MAIRSAAGLLFPGFNHTERLLGSMPHQISQGVKIPEAWVYRKEKDEFKLVHISKELSEGKAVVFTVPGPFTPVCSREHFPQFVRFADKFKLFDIQKIFCIAVANYDVMQAWIEQYGAQEKITAVPDVTGELTWGLGLGTSSPRLGFIAKRSAFYLRNGVVQVIYVEDDPKQCHISNAQTIFNAVYALSKKPTPKYLALDLAKE